MGFRERDFRTLTLNRSSAPAVAEKSRTLVSCGTRPRIFAEFVSSLEWVGAHVMILSSQYRIELPLLVSAIERYVREPRARAGLAIPRLPEVAG